MKPKNMKVQPAMCRTCPFRDGVADKYKDVQPVLLERIFSEASHICHSTGSNNAFHHRTGKKVLLCRGARNLQLKVFHAIGFITAPTDEAWNSKVKEMGL